ncbi:thioesterase family protein [Paenibacillus sp. FSL W8-0186]|uniref:acyl-CoA thioesterase n=1 Tax=Paenibacillus TaxID=44249 RepID=UPI0030CEA7B0
MMESTWEFKVRFGETDMAGIVYYPNFYQWMDSSTHEMLRQTSYPTTILSSIKKGFPLVEAQCKFYHSLRFDDEVQVISKVKDVKNKVVVIEHRFIKKEDQQVVAEGQETRVWVSFAEGNLKAEAIPDDLRQVFMK